MAKVKTRTVVVSQFRLFNEVKTELMKWNIAHIEEESGVTNQTLYNWLNGITMFPRIDTLTKVAEAMGFEIALVKAKGGKKERHLRVVK